MNNGITPINKILDKIAYITLLTNVPMAVYDAKKISNNFFVGLDNQQHNVLCFDNIERTTNSDDIIIKSDNQILSIAGCIGSKNFGVDQNTTSVVVEICNFNFINIRNTSKRLNINTDAAKRFSKQISSYLMLLTINLIQQGFNEIEYLKLFYNPINEVKFEID
jgi:phenylalanyl-tRNA synthetase beta chain